MLNKQQLAALVKRATTGITSGKREAEQAAQHDLDRRQAAATILNPNEVSGEYDAGRLLQTSMGGHIRPLTHADLRAFQNNVARLKKKFTGGITAQSVIDMALPVDKERANKEIRMAVPANVRGGRVHFITNAGPDSDVARHHVHVNFLDFDAAVGASPNDRSKIGKMVSGGKLAFDCDCGRHTFWYRYIATIGRYNSGRAETGFPKIRNPKLQGVACKHTLRVMHVILKDRAVQLKIAESVVSARDVLDKRKIKNQKTKVDDLRQLAEAQHSQRRSGSNLKSTTEKQAAAAVRKAKADMKRGAVEAAKAKPKASPRDVARHASALLAMGAITQDMFNQITKAAK
jgi:hypothetical protein